MTTASGIRIVPADWDHDRATLRGIREAVFVHEQHVPLELEWDDMDAICAHVIAYADGDTVVGTARLLPDGHIGRMAVLKPWRGRGIGSLMLRTLVEIATARGMQAIELNAQTHALAFYERHGFVAEGEEFDDAGIAHRHMVWRP